MARGQPALRRSRVRRESGRLLVDTPMRKPIFSIVFMMVWLTGWIPAGIASSRALLTDSGASDRASFLAFWLFGWAIGLVLAVGYLLIALFGHERIELSRQALVIRFEVLGRGRTRRYDPAGVALLRVLDPGSWWSRESQNVFDASLAFNYGARTVSFGRGLSKVEAGLVLQEMVATGALRQPDLVTALAMS